MNEDNIRFYGGEEDQVFTAPVGTVYPVDLSPLGAAYKGLGLMSEDGMEEEMESDNAEVRVHQGFRIARTKIVGVKHTFKVTCSERNAETLKLRHPGATRETTGGVTVIRGLEKMVPDVRQIVQETFDGTIHTRRVHTRAEVTERATLAQKANEPTVYEFTFTSYGEIVDITNDPALVADPVAP